MTPGTCSICSRPDAAEIDQALATGGSGRAVANRFNLARSSVQRHLKNHVGPRLRRASNDRKDGSDPALLERLEELNRYARGVLGRAVKSGQYSAAVAAIREAREQLVLQAKLLGEFHEGGGPVVNINVGDPEALIRMAIAELNRRGYRVLPPEAPAIAVGAAPEVQTSAEAGALPSGSDR